MIDPYYTRGQLAEQIATLRRRIEALEQAHTVGADRPPHFTTLDVCKCRAHDLYRLRASLVDGVKHTRHHCGASCVHGVFIEGDDEGCEACDPPAPEWRRLVDEQHGDMVGPGLALWNVLHMLRDLSAPPEMLIDADQRKALARIVAVAEAQVGDGWKADPDHPRIVHNDGSPTCSLPCLLLAVSRDEDNDRWQLLGQRAAHWLRSITEDGAQ